MRVLVEDRLPAVPGAAAAPGVLRALGLTTETEKQVLEFESSPIDAIFGVMLKERFTECLGRDVAYTPEARSRSSCDNPNDSGTLRSNPR